MKCFLIALCVSILSACSTIGSGEASGFDAEPIAEGEGQFTLETEQNNSVRPVTVHFYRPETYKKDSPILLVIPGGGRNGDTYRDVFIQKADEYGFLVLAPSFAETEFPGPINYNLARMIDDNIDRRNIHNFKLRENPSDWIFEDLDRIFDYAVEASGSTRKKYDIFGHSAGGQIVHRQVLFAENAKIDRAIAANSGWYTAAVATELFPYGLADAKINRDQIEQAFNRKLTILVGELDNASETRGHLRRTPEADKQGDGRLSRGKYFFDTAKVQARDFGLKYAWEIEVVDGVGHSYRKMGAAASDLLYAR